MLDYLRDDEDEFQPGPTLEPDMTGGGLGLDSPQPTPRGPDAGPVSTVPGMDWPKVELPDSGYAPTTDAAEWTPPLDHEPNSKSVAGGLDTIFPGAQTVAPLDLTSQRINLPRRGFNPADTELDPYLDAPQDDQASSLIQAILAMLG